MNLLERAKLLAEDLTGASAVNRLSAENSELRNKERTAIEYIRRKVNQLLTIMGTLPLKPEELDDQTLLELDPIGIVAESFAQVLDHLNETNEKLQIAHDEIQAIFSAAGVAILVVDNKMQIKAYNPRLRDLFRHTEGNLQGHTCHRLLCGLDCPPQNCTFTRVTTAKRPIHQENWQFGDRVFDVSGAPVKNRYGEITHVVLAYSDITDRSRSEEALRESEQMYRTLFENAHDMIQSVSTDGQFMYVNPAWRKALGYEPEEIASLSLSSVIHPDHIASCANQFQKLVRGEFSGHVSTVFITKGGRSINVEGNVTCCFQGGKPLYTCGIFREALPDAGTTHHCEKTIPIRP
jgi:PAS domain S-box-containing protein